jgi:ATP-binding cassette subfamily B (MDR/TAP) protein 1
MYLLSSYLGTTEWGSDINGKNL